MKDQHKDILTVAGSGLGGAAIGLGALKTIGGIGIAATGTAFAFPVIAVGAGIGLAIGGSITIGRLIERRKHNKKKSTGI